MPGSLKGLKSVSDDLIDAANKRRKLAKLLKKSNLLPLGKGAWLGYRGKDVVSGLLVEGSPLDIYISAFLLPIFDENTFVSWSLGRRFIHCSNIYSAETEMMYALNLYHEEIFSVKSADSLITYLDNAKKVSFYPIWVRYLCYLRNASLEKACLYLDDKKKSELHPSILKRLAQIDPSVVRGDTNEVALILERWEKISRIIFGSGEYSL